MNDDPGDLPSPAQIQAGTAGQLLSAAWRSIAEATTYDDPTERFDAANVAALRAAAAVVSVRAHPRRRPSAGGRGRETVWELLPRIAPELREWADFFGMHSRVRGFARADHSIQIGQRQADDLLRDADRFAHEVRGLLLHDRAASHARSVQ